MSNNRKPKTLNFPIRLNTRLNMEQANHIQDLLEIYPDLFDNFSHVVRCAINHFHRTKIGEYHSLQQVSQLRKNKTVRSDEVLENARKRKTNKSKNRSHLEY